MAKRFVDTELWQKEWFQDLTLKQKVLVKYIFENCDCAGVWETNYRMASFIIGEKITKDDITEINQKKLMFNFIEKDKIYVKNFIEFQYGKLSYNCKPHIPVIKLLEKYGIEYEVIDDNNLTIKQKRKRLTETARKNIFNRDKYQCQYCGSHDNLEIDHIIPLSKGGTNEDDNLITACHNCNSLKGDKDLKEFINCNNRNIKFLDRVSKILDTLEEKEKEQEQYKEKEKEKENTSFLKEEDCNLYGEYNNVHLTKSQYGKLVSLCMSNKLLNELINSFSSNIEVGKERPYNADLPNAHYERLKSYHAFRVKNPDKFKEEPEQNKPSSGFMEFYEKEKARLIKEGIY